MASTAIQPVNTAANIESVLKLIQGGTTLVKGSSSSTTTQSNISDKGVQALLQQILSGTQGLGAVTSAQRGAGLYNSSTNQMLVNDLLTRASAEVEAKRAGTTTTTKQNPQLGGSDLVKLLAAAAVKKYAGPALGKAGGKIDDLLTSAGKSLSDLVSGTGSAVSTGADIGVSGVATNAAGDVVGAGSAALDALANSIFGDVVKESATSAATEAGNSAVIDKLMESIGNFSTAPEAGSTIASGASTLGSSYDFYGDTTNAFSSAGSTGNSLSFSSGGSDASSGAGSWGGYFSAFMQALNNEKTGNRDYRQAVGTAIASYFGIPSGVTALAAPTLNKFSNSIMDNGYDQNGIAGAFYEDPIGTLVSGQYDLGDTFNALSDPMNLFGGNPGGSIGRTLTMPIDFVGNQIEAIGNAIGWIVCTELYRQGRMPRRFYVHGSRVFASYPKDKIKGYYVWAIPCVKFLRKKPNSRRAKILEWVFNTRAEYLAAQAGERTARKTFKGALITHGLYAFCWTLSFFVPEQDWSVVYG